MPVLHCILSLRGISYKEFFFVLLFYMRFYISKYHFYSFFNIVWNKDFFDKFVFF